MDLITLLGIGAGWVAFLARTEIYHKLTLLTYLFLWPILLYRFSFFLRLFLYFCPSVRSGDITVGMWVCTYKATRCIISIIMARYTIWLCALVIIGSFGQSHDQDCVLQIRPPYLNCSFCFRFLRNVSGCALGLTYFALSSLWLLFSRGQASSMVKTASRWWRLDKASHDSIIDRALRVRVLCRNSLLSCFCHGKREWMNLSWWRKVSGFTKGYGEVVRGLNDVRISNMGSTAAWGFLGGLDAADILGLVKLARSVVNLINPFFFLILPPSKLPPCRILSN